MEIAMSRTIKFAKAGGPEVLEFIETQVPAPGPREVRIKVKANRHQPRRVNVAQ
jgi:NADPH:quinone reductase-like Zn-dependent oxidoreductase